MKLRSTTSQSFVMIKHRKSFVMIKHRTRLLQETEKFDDCREANVTFKLTWALFHRADFSQRGSAKLSQKFSGREKDGAKERWHKEAMKKTGGMPRLESNIGNFENFWDFGTVASLQWEGCLLTHTLVESYCSTHTHHHC